MAKKKILILEDSEDMQMIYRDMFEGLAEYDIDIEENVENALAAVAKKRYDLAIVDIIMEKISGDVFCVHVREKEKRKKLPIIVVSVLAPAATNHLKEMKNITSLQKPIKKEALLKIVGAMLTKSA